MKKLGTQNFLLNSAIGMAVTLVMLLLIEVSARLVPDRLLPAGARQVPLVAPVDRGGKLLQTHGYRGKRPCTDCPDSKIRIVTMGGSSTFGVPMRFSGKTYSAILQKLLDTRPASEQYEVLNAGIAGFGIWQIVEALERTVLVDKPDIVMICPWFNDSSWIPGWYGFPDLSDKEAFEVVKKLRTLESSSWYKILRNSQAYALMRFGVQWLLKKEPTVKKSSPRQERKRRSSPAEFRAGVEYFLALAEKHNFLPIFVTEALNRTRPWDDLKDQHPYYKVLFELGQQHGVPIVDTLTPLAQRPEEWLFYDFIHPNEHGHGTIAQAIFESFFDVSWHTERSRSWFWRQKIALAN